LEVLKKKFEWLLSSLDLGIKLLILLINLLVKLEQSRKLNSTFLIHLSLFIYLITKTSDLIILNNQQFLHTQNFLLFFTDFRFDFVL